MPKVAVLLYVYYPEKWSEIHDLLFQIKDSIDVFLAVCRDIDCTHIIQECKQNFCTKKVFVCENKGLDLYPFLKQLNTLNFKKYPYFLKLHTKKSLVDNTFEWSDCLLNSTIGTKEIFNQNLLLLENSEIGALCDQNFIITNNERTHKSAIEHLCNILDIDYEKVSLGSYMAGSIFFGKTKNFQEVYTKTRIQLIEKLLEPAESCSQLTVSYTYALECVLGYALAFSSLKIEKCYTPTKLLFNKQLNKNLNLVLTHRSTCYIKENPLMCGVVISQSNTTLNIIWSHCDNNEYEYILCNNVFIRNDKDSNGKFNAIEYKNLYPDLIQLSSKEAEAHFYLHGKSEGRVECREKILKVFDKEYYAKEYNTKLENAFENYIEKGRFEGRVFSPEIAHKKLDYGFCISYKPYITKNNLYNNMYDVCLNEKRYINNLIEYTDNNTLNTTCCIYVANIQCTKDMYYALNDLEELKKHCKNVIIVSNKQIKDYECVICLNPVSFNWRLQFINIGLNHSNIHLYENYVILSNETTVISNINSILLKLQNNNKDVLSLTDCYTKHIHTGVPMYHLQCDLIFFKKKNLSLFQKYIDNFLKENIDNFLINELFEFELTSFLIKKKKKIGSILTPTHELEFFWKDLLNIKLNLLPGVLYKYRIPIIKKENLFYFKQLIPNNFKKQKHTFKLKSYFCLQTQTKKTTQKIAVILHVFYKTHVSEFKNYIKSFSKLCKNVTFFITGNKEIYKELKTKNTHFFESKNRGMDIGPFLEIMQSFLTQNIEYDYIIKLQDKATNSWRKYCFENIINNLTHYIDILQDANVGVIGPYNLLEPLDMANFETIEIFLKKYSIPFNYKQEYLNNAFIAGTMFVIKHNIFNEFIKKYNIDLKYEYNMLEEGKVTNLYATNTHAWERIFTCILPTVMQTKLTCI